MFKLARCMAISHQEQMVTVVQLDPLSDEHKVRDAQVLSCSCSHCVLGRQGYSTQFAHSAWTNIAFVPQV